MVVARVETVRGSLSDARAEEIIAFWSRHGALSGQAASDRLAEVICVLRDGDDIVGVNSAGTAAVQLVGGREFWLYRRFLDPTYGERECEVEMLNAAFDALDAAHTPGDTPVGLGVVVAREELDRAPRDLVWPDTHLFHAGFLPDGSQLRIRYFDGARVV